MSGIGDRLMGMLFDLLGYREPPEHEVRERQSRVTAAKGQLRDAERRANLTALQAQATVSDGWRHVRHVKDHGREQEWRGQ